MKTIRSSIVRFTLCVGVCGVAVAQESIDSLMRRDSVRYSWTHRTWTGNELRHLPSRTLEGLMTFTPGITRVNSSLYARGSRVGEIEYRFGGMPVLDRWTNTNAIPFIPEMLERVDVHTGAYHADLGSFGGGVVEMQLREAGDEFSAQALVLTDDFAPPGKQILNTSSYGWTSAVVTVGTPLPFESKLFVAGEFAKQANRIPMYLEPINITLDRDPVVYPQYQPPPEPFVIGRNHVPSQSADRSVLQWNLTTRFAGPLVEFFGSTSLERSRDITWPTAVRNYYRQQRIPWSEQNATFAALRVSEEVMDGFRVSGAVAYSRQRTYTNDPDLGESWRLYADSAANAAKGYPNFTSRYYGPTGYSSIIYFFFDHASAPTNTYQQESSNTWTANIQAEVDLSDSWKLTFAGEAEWWTLRHFRVGSISGVSNLDFNQDGVNDRVFTSAEDERIYTKGALQITNFGYTYRGAETDEGMEGPRKPSFMSASVASAWHEEGFSVDAGLRAQWIDLAMPTVPRQRNPVTGGYDWQDLDAIWNFNLSSFRNGALTTTGVESFILPRLSIQYAMSPGRVYVSYGEYVETLPHKELQLDDQRMAQLLNPVGRVPYNLGGDLITFRIRPSRTSQTEIGAEFPVAPGVTLTGVAYHKTMTGQVQMGRLPSTTPNDAELVAYDNSGESNASGMEFGVDVHPSGSFGLGFRYAWSQHQGVGSYPRSNRQYFTDEYGPDRAQAPPPILRPLDYGRTHRALILLNFIPEEDAMLHGLDLRTIATFESGTPYTKEQTEPMYLGSSTPWNIAVRGLQDVRTFRPDEPTNASRTPWIATVDVALSYEFIAGPTQITVFTLITNLFDTKNVLNVYPKTGSPSSDGWLGSEFAPNFVAAYPQYEQFYRAINLQDRWAYMSVTGNDIYGTPRQIQVGVKVGI